MTDWKPSGSDPVGGDPYLEWDAAYVLGALSPSERRAYEEHLTGCPHCQAAVASIAGLPGLLGQVTPEEAAQLADAPDAAPPPPATLLPGLLDRARRRKPVPALLVAVAAALLLLAGSLGVLAAQGIGPFGPDDPYRVAFSPVRPSPPMVAVAVVTPQEEGTGFQLECAYGEDKSAAPTESHPVYEIWVTDRSGGEQMAKSWPVRANRVMRPEAHSPLPEDRIDHLEIRSAGGEPLLRASLR